MVETGEEEDGEGEEEEADGITGELVSSSSYS